MTFYTDLLALLETRIEAAYDGTLAELGDQSPFGLSLPEMLKVRDYLTAASGGGSITNYALETGGNLANIALATGLDNATIPTRTVLVGGNHDGKIENIKVDQTGAIVVNATGQQSSINSFSVVLATDQPSVTVSPKNAATSTLANVASSATSVSLLAANNNRKTAIIINDSTSDLYVTLNASAASTTNYSLFLAAKVGNTPSSLILKGDDYSGEIRGIWSSANGFARITEIV